MSKENVPLLRFKGFINAWEQRKLGELFKPSRNKNNNGLYNQKDILAASLGTELIPKRIFFGLKSTKESVKNYRVVKNGDLIYTKSPIKGFPNGIVRTNKGNVGIVPSLYCVYQAQKEINTSIIQLYFEDKNRLNFYLFPLVNVGARNNVNITDLEFLEGIVKVPKSIEEQKKIVDFIEHFNKAITLHQRKLDLLKQLKKGFLQQMFPKNGETTPKLRFTPFADDWGQRKLGNYIIQYDKVTVKNNQYPVFTSSRKGLFFQKDYYDGHQIASADNTGYNIVPRGYFTYRHMSDDLIFKFNINSLTDFGIVSTLYPVFTTNKELNSKYLQYQLNEGNEFKRFAILQKQGGSRTYMYLSKLKNLMLTMPNLEEQVRLASFFTLLDNTITLHQQKIILLKQLKKEFLQKLFI